MTKVGGALSVVGLLIGAFLWSDTRCSTRLGAGKVCRNIAGEVRLDQFGQPPTLELLAIGGLIGAVSGAALGFVIAKLWPSTKADLFP